MVFTDSCLVFDNLPEEIYASEKKVQMQSSCSVRQAWLRTTCMILDVSQLLEESPPFNIKLKL